MPGRRAGLILLSSALLLTLAAGPARAQCDTVEPAFTAFGFTPSSVNTTAAAVPVTCTITVTDALAGVASAGCMFQSPTFQHTASCSSAAPTSGTRQNGVFSCVVTLPRYAESGTWLANLSATDQVGNEAQLSWFQFPVGFPMNLSVTSDPDLAAPALTTLAVTPSTINTSAASANVTCNMTVTDAKSGVSTASCFFQAPGSQQPRGCSSNAPTSGTRQNGTFSCMATFARYSDAGVWPSAVFLMDGVGNFAQAFPAPTVTVTSSPEDVTGPANTLFTFSPTSVSTGAASQNVTCTMQITDSPAGVDVASCDFTYTDPGTSQTYDATCSSATPSAGTRNSGTFTCMATLPRYSPGGLWTASATYLDLTGNSTDVPSATSLNVSCAGADAETTCRFSTKTTLTWDAVAGATRYNVYRGNVSGLVDVNLDHVPDGGYGTCQNASDPILTDTTFEDPAIPTAGQKGFHYLVSYTSGGVEKGLGINSFGSPRTVTPCP